MKNLALGLLLSVVSISAFAESPASADVLFGSAKQASEIDGEELTSGDDMSFGVRVAFNANEFLALELAYQNYGETDDTYIDAYGDTIHDNVSATAITFGAKGIIPLDNNIALNARLGISSWDLELLATDSSIPGKFKADDTGTDLYYGIGIQFKLNPQMSLGVEYTVTQMQPSIDGTAIDHDVSNLAVSLGYSF